MHAQIVPNFRVRIIPVLGTMPAIFGLAAASHVLCALAGQPFQSEPVFRLLEPQYETQLQRLTEREELVYCNFEGPAVDLDDVSIPLCQCLANQYSLDNNLEEPAAMLSTTQHIPKCTSLLVLAF